MTKRLLQIADRHFILSHLRSTRDLLQLERTSKTSRSKSPLTAILHDEGATDDGLVSPQNILKALISFLIMSFYSAILVVDSHRGQGLDLPIQASPCLRVVDEFGAECFQDFDDMAMVVEFVSSRSEIRSMFEVGKRSAFFIWAPNP